MFSHQVQEATCHWGSPSHPQHSDVAWSKWRETREWSILEGPKLRLTHLRAPQTMRIRDSKYTLLLSQANDSSSCGPMIPEMSTRTPRKILPPHTQADRCSHPPLGKPSYSKAASGTLLLERATTRREVPRRVLVLAPQCHQGKWSGNFQELEEFPLCLCRMERSWQHWNTILFCSKGRFNGSKINFRM